MPHRSLAAKVQEDLEAAIEAEFPKAEVPDELTHETLEHEDFAASRRAVYVKQDKLFKELDAHAASDGPPLVIEGAAGSGKSALLANWVEHWRATHEQDVIITHYVGATSKSSERCMLGRPDCRAMDRSGS
ncbi:MAG: hypothetical protein IPM46_04065 [Flavobacteriales bacterium]|nr:hypothetical protein [Flavobacteriales bacterium]